jgi:hypothetical protein
MFLVPALILLLSVSTTALPLAQGGPSKPILEGIPALEGVPVNIHPGGPGIPVLPQHNCTSRAPPPLETNLFTPRAPGSAEHHTAAQKD